MSKTYLDLSAVGMRFKTEKGFFEALVDVNLKIAKGEFISLIGHSGCGKSTVLNLVAGLTEATSGGIILDGREVDGPGPERSVVFQNHALLPWLTVYQNVELAVRQVMKEASKKEIEEKVRYYLSLVQMDHALDKKPHEISGGMKQRVGIARALAANPQLLLLDEPFGALDAFTREQMQTLLLRLWHETGKQVLLITHDIEEAVFMATELVLLSPGPGRVLERLPLEFARRYVAGEPVRSIKSDPLFIEQREYVLSRVFEQREAFS